MHGAGFDLPLQEWFDHEVPETTVEPDYIELCVAENADTAPRPSALVIWMGQAPQVNPFVETDADGTEIALTELVFYRQKDEWGFATEAAVGDWLASILPILLIGEHEPMTFAQLKKHYESQDLGRFEEFTASETWEQLRENGLLVL
jgi:hypothetical protein